MGSGAYCHFNEDFYVSDEDHKPIKNCPFCGTDSRLHVLSNVIRHGVFVARATFVQCENIECGATGPENGCQSPDYFMIDDLPKLSIEGWNKRT